MFDWKLKEIEFIEETHQYLVNGILTPSVTTIIKWLYPHKYEGIPLSILKNKAEFGNNVHKAIENHVNGLYTDLSPLETIAFEEYIKLKEKHTINPIQCEKTISYKYSYAGRLDMIADVNYTRCLVDIKTTAKVETELLEWQLGMYKLALEEEGIKIGDCYCLWLPKKSQGEFIKISPKNKKQIDEMLKKYEQEHNTD